MRLPDPDASRAVLIGTSVYATPEIPDLPAVRNNLIDLAAILTSPSGGGLDPSHCVSLFDPADARSVFRTLKQSAAAATDTFVVYFAGHGFTGPQRSELFLGLAETDPDELRFSALEFKDVREVFVQHTSARNRVLIMDCCYSGRATMEMGSPEELVVGQSEVQGTFTLVSAPPNAPALAPPGATYTAFTGELVSLLRDGWADGPELLTMGTIYQRLYQRLSSQGFPLPHQRGTDSAHQLGLVRNRAFRPQTLTPTPRQEPSEAAAPPDELRTPKVAARTENEPWIPDYRPWVPDAEDKARLLSSTPAPAAAPPHETPVQPLSRISASVRGQSAETIIRRLRESDATAAKLLHGQITRMDRPSQVAEIIRGLDASGDPKQSLRLLEELGRDSDIARFNRLHKELATGDGAYPKVLRAAQKRHSAVEARAVLAPWIVITSFLATGAVAWWPWWLALVFSLAAALGVLGVAETYPPDKAGALFSGGLSCALGTVGITSALIWLSSTWIILIVCGVSGVILLMGIGFVIVTENFKKRMLELYTDYPKLTQSAAAGES